MKKLNCLIIHGSPRRGNTWDVLNRVKNEMDSYGDFNWDVIELGKVNIKGCIGCFNCIFKGENYCPHNIEMKKIIDKIESAEAIILTTPVYSMQLSGLLKNFIDHMSFNFHRPKYFKKKAFVIVTTAGAGHKETANYIESVLEYWGVNYIEKLPIAYRAEFLTEKNISLIKNKSKKFALELNSKKIHKAKLKSVVMFNAWKAMGLNFNENTADYQYWSNLENKNKIYDEVPVGVFSKVIGFGTYKILKKSKNKE